MISSQIFPIKKFISSETIDTFDNLAVEEPLEIQLSFPDEQNQRKIKPLSVTMRTPADGEDTELAAGFLFTEGIIKKKKDFKRLIQIDEHVVLAELDDLVKPDLSKLERHFYTSSSCGVCGKTSIGAVKVLCPARQDENSSFSVSKEIINSLPVRLREKQNTFNSTGGLHASALFDLNGNLILVKEDVGRHNALDKLIGAALMKELLPLKKNILLLSGRASFELIQKAAMAEINIVCAVGAPSSLAVQLAKETNMTLLGFLRDERFNIYSGEHRIEM